MLLSRINDHIGSKTNEEIAKSAGCTAQTIRNARRGRGVTLNTAKRIAKALKVKLEAIQ